MPRVVYFNIDTGVEYEQGVLAEQGVAGLELVSVKGVPHTTEAFVEAVAGADGAVVEYFEVTGEAIAQLPDLKILAVQAIGYSNIDVAAASEHGVAVTNAPGFCSEDVALHTAGLIIDLVRKISFLDRSVRAGHWDPLWGGLPQRISGKTIGLAFFGSIPQHLVPLLGAMGLRIIAWAPTKSAEFLAGFGVEKVETLQELLRLSDIVSLHTPLMPSTHHLIGAAELALMKPTAFLINTARGPVVDEPALVEALRTGGIAGAGIDVIEDEDAESSELFGLDNVVITPHAAFISEQSLLEAQEIALTQFVQCLVEGVTPSNQVNAPVVAGETK